MTARSPGCACGSGAHPRRCLVHPDAFDRHCALLDAEMGEPDAGPFTLRGPVTFTGRTIQRGPFTLLQHSAEPVGGWDPEGIGTPHVREEGPLHPRVGTVVREDDDLPIGTHVDANAIALHTVVVCTKDGWWWPTLWSVTQRKPVGARILYVPLGEP